MKKIKVFKLILAISILTGCAEHEESDIMQPQKVDNLYSYYPELETNTDIQNDKRSLQLLKYLADNPQILGITELEKLQIATKSFSTNPNNRTNSNELWNLICSDSTVIIHDIIVPIRTNTQNNNSRGLNGDDCDCVSTTTGLEMPDDVCGCDEENSENPGDDDSGNSNNEGSSPSSYTAISYGSPSSIESFFSSPSYGGGVTTATNSDPGAGNILLIPTNAPLELILNLSATETNWLESNPVLENEIKEFLAESFSSPESVRLSKMAVNSAINGGVVDLAERLVYNPHLDQGYKDQMAEEEKEIFEGLSTSQKTAYLMSAQQASNYAEAYHGGSLYNGNGDAVRHAFWNALTTVRIGDQLTKTLTDAHESDPFDPNYPNHYKEKEMDLHNNGVGRNIAFQAGKLYQLVEAALSSGNLRRLSRLSSTGKATNHSNLIPTSN